LQATTLQAELETSIVIIGIPLKIERIATIAGTVTISQQQNSVVDPAMIIKLLKLDDDKVDMAELVEQEVVVLAVVVEAVGHVLILIAVVNVSSTVNLVLIKQVSKLLINAMGPALTTGDHTNKTLMILQNPT
jgi:hypothetical protein